MINKATLRKRQALPLEEKIVLTMEKIETWVMKAYLEHKETKAIVLLIPVQTDRVWFHGYIWDRKNHRTYPGIQVRFLKGRLRFFNLDKGQPTKQDSIHSMMLIVFYGTGGSLNRKL